MRMSHQGLELLIAREGKKNAVYRDSKGILTAGVGHTGPDVHEGDVWSDEKVETVLAADLARFEKAINDAVKVPLLQNQFDALVSWAFNVGASAAAGSTLVRKINEGDMDEAARQFDRWHIPPEITARRNGEREQFKGTRFEARIA